MECTGRAVFEYTATMKLNLITVACTSNIDNMYTDNI